MSGFLRRIVAALLILVPLPALAGDAAELNILGFSPDGGIFAFEEYGTQDGSGFPYANRFYIDTASDTFVPGSPIRVRLDDETATLAAARDEARAKGEAIVPDATLAENRGYTAASNPIGEYSADPHRVVIGSTPNYFVETTEFRLEELPAAVMAECYDVGEAKRFRLTRVAPSPGGVPVVLHEDKSVPKSRGCATGYRIGGVQLFHAGGGNPQAMVLIAVQKVGFESPDYRWIAVPSPAQP